MKSLTEMISLYKTNQTIFLTVEEAKKLKGKQIQVICKGYSGYYTLVFVVGDIVSELEYYRTLKEDCFPKDGFCNRAEYWEQILSKEQIERAKNNMLLLREDGRRTDLLLGCDGETFACMDADIFVSYIVL
jgi:hypothetical protein